MAKDIVMPKVAKSLGYGDCSPCEYSIKKDNAAEVKILIAPKQNCVIPPLVTTVV